MQLLTTPLPGLLLIQNFAAQDDRGLFVKTYHRQAFREAGLEFEVAESFYSFSTLGVIRGMHYQAPPYAHAKLVCCPLGEIEDVVLDLRHESPTFGQHYAVRLSASNRLALFIPVGMAHGFQALQDHSLTLYYTSHENVPAADKGIRWDSFGHQWPLPPTVISPRDQNWPSFSEHFTSPFSYIAS
jgi:dTDP-4-dehydrorhamnose 3,5-epimerase